MNIVILGRPGAGKGVQSHGVARHFGLARISTGDLFRLGLEAGVREFDAYISGARLASDQVVASLLRPRLLGLASSRGCVLEGFPRRVSQAEMLTEMLSPQRVDHAVYIDVSPAAAVNRLLGRTACPQCAATYPRSEVSEGFRCPVCRAPVRRRADDEPAKIQRRMDEFDTETEPVVRFYRRLDLLRRVDGESPPGVVLRRIVDACVAPDLQCSRVAPRAS